MSRGVARGITTAGLKTDVHVQIAIAPEASISMFSNAQFVDRISTDSSTSELQTMIVRPRLHPFFSSLDNLSYKVTLSYACNVTNP